MFKKLSPSKIYCLAQCKLRYILYSEKKLGKKNVPIFNKYSFLGIVIHSVVETFVKERNRIESFDSVWDSQMHSLIQKYQLSDEFVRNLNYQLPSYIVKKEKLRLLIGKMLTENFEAEVKLETEDIYGYADLVKDDKINRKVSIIDLKTGPIWQYSKGEINGVKEGYITQLKTYGLVYKERGYSANDIKCCLQGLSKDEFFSIVFTDKEYAKHKRYIKSIKQEVRSLKDLVSFNELANPNPESCMYCENMAGCVSLHLAIKDGELLDQSFVVVNGLNSKFDDVNLKITIVVQDKKKSLCKISDVNYFSIKNIVSDGGEVFISGLYHIPSTYLSYWNRFTTFQKV